MTNYLKCRIAIPSKKEISNMENIPTIPIMDKVTFTSIILNKKEESVKLYGRNYDQNLFIFDGEVLFNRARKLWKHMENMIINEKPIPQSVFLDVEEVVNLLWHTARNIPLRIENTLWDSQNNPYKFFQLLKNSIVNVSKLRNNLISKFTCNTITLKSEPISEYFHLYLAVKYLILYIDNALMQEKDDGNIKQLMTDLIGFSSNIYDKNRDNFLDIEPFPCICAKRLWLYLIHYLKKSIGKFWSIFNEAINDKDQEFTAWITYYISILYLHDDMGFLIGVSSNIQDNYELIIKLLQSVTSSNSFPAERKILNILKSIHPLFMEVWVQNPKLEPYQILWEYFYKNLDKTNLGDIKLPKTVQEMVEFIDRLNTKAESSENSYEYFLYMLCNHLKKNTGHWNKMRGRIYSRLPPQKMNNFNNNAIFQISLLFIMLSQANVDEAIDKLYSLLEALSRDKQETELIWIINLTLMIINIRNNRNIKNISTIIRNQIEEVASNREKFSLIKHYVVAIDIIMNSNQNYELGQNILLGSWITPYTNSCTYSDLCQLLDNITCMIIQVENCGKWYEFKHSFTEFVLPALKRISLSNTVPPQVGELVGKICLNTQELTHPTMQYFCNSTVNIKVTHKFLITILGNNHYLNFSLNEENLLLSSWFRICILSTETSHQDLSKYIFQLSTVRSIVTIENFESDPYTAFVKSLCGKIDMQTNMSRLKELCEICFGNVDQWLNVFLTPNISDTQTTYLYTTISLFFYLCSPLLYHKSKSTCLFNRLVSLLLLPTEVLMGKPPPSNILKAIEKTWHLFIKGIYKLGHSSDPYIDRTLKDLVIRYVPHFPSNNSPILNILDDLKIASVVFEKISNAFFLRVARSSEENTHKALKTLQNILDNTREEHKINLILEKTLLGILEVIMFNNQKVLALDLIKSLISAGWYEQVQSKLQVTIETITNRHLAFNTSNYFQLIGNLINIIPSSVRTTLPHIKKQISHVEKMRGVGFDNILRQGLDKIEKALS